MSVTLIFKNKTSLPYGNGSRGRYISHTETGGSDIFVPSFGAMEKEEVDYVVEGAIEKERARVKRRETTRTRELLESYVGLAHRTKPGKRGEAIREAMKQKERHI